MPSPTSKKEKYTDPVGSPNSASSDTNMNSGESDFEEPEALPLKKLSSDEIKVMRAYNVERIKEVDQLAVDAIAMFFENRVSDCEKLLEKNLFGDPIYLAGSGLVVFLRYCMCFEQPVADKAIQLVETSSSFSSDLHPSTGIMKRIGGAFTRSDPKSKWLKAGEYRAKVIHAECQAIRCFILILQQSVTAVMKAGVALKRAYNLYTELDKERKERARVEGKPMTEIGLDLNSLYCVDFGLGAINLALSMLPSNIASMLNFFGMSGDRDTGFEYIIRCFESDTLLSPFASALLLCVFALVPFFSPILVPKYVPAAKIMAKRSLEKPSMANSLLHRWLIGRVRRLERLVEESSETINYVLNECDIKQIVETMPQLRHIAIYDDVINNIILFRWEKAIECCTILHSESKWSQIFYLYIEGACYEMLAHACIATGDAEKELECRKNATKSYWKAMHNKTTVLGGKVIRIDQFVAKRLCEITELAGIKHPNPDNKKTLTELAPLPEDCLLKNLISLPAYEIVVLFNLSHQVPKSSLERMTSELWEQVQWEIPYSDNTTNNTLCKVAEKFLKENNIPSVEPHTEEQAAEIKRRVKQMNTITNGYGRMLFYLTALGTLMSNAEEVATQEKAMPLLKAVADSPKYKDKFTSLSYCRPLAMYEIANVTYYTSDGDSKLTLDLLDKFNKEYSNPHYYFHSSIDTKVHLVQQFLKKPTDPITLSADDLDDNVEEDSASKEEKHESPSN
ncbi:tetratricopeptidedomain 39C [Angomonas deanei]|uniref:Uncharacterized protein n=1 Tax=Angomonas deanei TaxID=59799 RepID=A0A7G2C8G6_9TRYP|nr:tetratricopeptidedomain 39C [Angomonas deanei]CAD2215033.1 Protein of unknown function (DUF3808), putative [Angomonas deanei]|eukprot:EPY30455.1 tetratricopeptidedomain 39C [Angomonas deanei]